MLTAGQPKFGTEGSRLNATFVGRTTFRVCAHCVGNVSFAKRRGILLEIAPIVIVVIGGRPPANDEEGPATPADSAPSSAGIDLRDNQLDELSGSVAPGSAA